MNFKKISYLLKLIPGFLKFIKYHQIAEDSIRRACDFFKYKDYKPGSYIYEWDEKPTHFFGIISGKVKIFKPKKVRRKILTKDKFRHKTIEIVRDGVCYIVTQEMAPDYEMHIVPEEFGTKGKGMCFGYDGLISKKPRTSTVLAIERTEMFTLEEKFFDECFNVNLP